MEPLEQEHRLFGEHSFIKRHSTAISFRRTRRQKPGRVWSREKSRRTCRSIDPEKRGYYIFRGTVRGVPPRRRVRYKWSSQDQQSDADDATYKSNSSQATKNKREEGRSKAAVWNRRTDGGGNVPLARALRQKTWERPAMASTSPICPQTITTPPFSNMVAFVSGPVFKELGVRHCIARRTLPLAPHAVAAAPVFKELEVRSCVGRRSLPWLDQTNS